MDPVSNPFSPGAGTPPPAFIGRADLLTSYEIALNRTIKGKPGKSLMPIGLRGVGKTVLLNRFAEMAADDRFDVAFIEAPEHSNFLSLLTAKLRKLLISYDGFLKAKQLARKALRILKSFSLTLPDGGPSVS